MEQLKNKKLRIGNIEVEALTLIFYAILIFGLLMFTLILLLRPTSDDYIKKYTDDIYTEVSISSSNKVKIKSVIGDTSIKKEGQLTEDKQNVIVDNYIYPITITEDNIVLNAVTYVKGE